MQTTLLHKGCGMRVRQSDGAGQGRKVKHVSGRSEPHVGLALQTLLGTVSPSVGENIGPTKTPYSVAAV